MQVRSDAVTVTSEHMQCHLALCPGRRMGAMKRSRDTYIYSGYDFAVHEVIFASAPILSSTELRHVMQIIPCSTCFIRLCYGLTVVNGPSEFRWFYLL